MKRLHSFVFAFSLPLSGCIGADPLPMDRAVSISSPPRGAAPAVPTTAPFILDAQRILIEAEFETPEGGSRTALLWFNMGMAAPVLSKALYRELHIGSGQELRIRIADHTIKVASETVIDGDGGLGVPEFKHLFAPQPVEAMLPAAILQNFAVTLDYKRHTLTLTEPSAQKIDGIAVPCTINRATGLVAIDAIIDGRIYPVVIDAGTGYTWMRGDIVAQWLNTHPDWQRAKGAVSQSNANMVDLAFEKDGIVARVPQMDLGAVHLTNIGVFGTAPIFGRFADNLVGDLFWDNWRKMAPKPVVGWLGGNALKNFKLTIDYPNHTTYWLKQSEPDPHDLDAVGLTLVRREDHYFVGGIVRKTGPSGTDNATVEGVEIGDEVIAIDGLPVRGTGKDAVLAALHGKPGERRNLILDRDGARRVTEASVTAFD